MTSEEAIKILEMVECHGSLTQKAKEMAIIALKELKDRPKGKWMEKDGYDGDTYYDCSICGESFTTLEGTPSDNLFNFCPNCGADMRGKAE